MLKPRVSVVIPAYNSERFVGEAIQSVLAQSYDNVECIVVNDGSTDRTAEVVEGFGERVMLVNQENRKLPGARNTGIRHATGEYISFLDADDRIAPQKIEHQLGYLQRHMDFGAVYSRIRYFEDGTDDFYFLSRPSPEGDLLDRLVFGNFIPVHSTLFRRELVLRVGEFRQFPALEDWDFLLRLSTAGCKFGFLDEVCADYRMHSGGMSTDSILMFEAKLQVITDLARSSGALLSAHGLSPEVVVNYHLADLGKALVLNGRASEGLAAIGTATKQAIPKRTKFLLFAAAARIFGSPLLVKLNELTYSRRKRQKENKAA